MTTASPRYVLQLCHSYYDPFLDCARQYAALFKNTAYQVVTVFLSGDADPAIAEKAGSDNVIFLGYQSKQLRGLKLNIIRDIRRITAEYDFDFCIAHRIKPTYVALLATRLPVLSVQHTFGCFDRFSRRLLVNIFKSRVNILAVSDALRDEIRDRLRHWPNNAIQTLYNHIEVDLVIKDLLPEEAARSALNIPPDAWVIGNVGRLHPDKDQHTLIAAFAKARSQLPENARLVIIGKGRLESRLKAQCADLGLSEQVIFTGPVFEARRYFRAFNVFALSSDREPFGMVLLEAMAADLPIICSDCGGGGEIVRPTGRVFPFADVDALAQQLIGLAALPATEQPGNTNYLRQNFSDEAVREKFWQTTYPALPATVRPD